MRYATTEDLPGIDLPFVMLVLLELNGVHIEASNEEFADIIMGVAASEKDDADLAKWVDAHI